ncbi:MAG: hypothetical protein V4792_20885 [Pseudomonadota bacterium]
MLMNLTVLIRSVALATWLVSVSGCANSQPTGLPSPSTRSEPHEALSFYEGIWTILDNKQEGYRETCSWLAEGRRHIVCRARVQGANGTRETLGVYSYDPLSGEYLYHGFGARGGVSTERGQRIPKGFLFRSERGTGADKVQVRFTIAEAAQGRVNTVSETSTAGGPWIVEERLEYLRTRP